MSKEEIQHLLDESYRFFYNDIGSFLLGKRILKLIFNPRFRWFRKAAFSFLTNGLTIFFLKLD